MIIINLVQKKIGILYPNGTTLIIMIPLRPPNGIFVVEVDLLQVQFHLIQFGLNYLILSCCFKKVVLAKSLMEGMFKLDGFSNFLLFLSFFFLNSLFQSWDDEDSNNGNSYNGSKPDGEYSGIFLENTKYFYCTYGPSFRIIFS